MAKRDADGKRPVNKGEFVATMALLGQRDRSKMRELRAAGWESVIPVESEFPN